MQCDLNNNAISRALWESINSMLKYLTNDPTTLLSFARLKPSNLHDVSVHTFMTRALVHHPLFQHTNVTESVSKASGSGPQAMLS